MARKGNNGRAHNIKYKKNVALVLIANVLGCCYLFQGPQQIDDSNLLGSNFQAAAPQSLPSYIHKISAVQGQQPAGKAQTNGIELKFDRFFGNRNGLYFVESGALNGIDHSNTLWLERERNWKGMLVEANPNNVKKCLKSGRDRSVLVDGCLSLTEEVSIVKFVLAGPLGGIADEIDSKQLSRIKEEIEQNRPWMDEENAGNSVDITCYPLSNLLNTVNVQVVDFWSLDTEGSELGILETVNFDKIMFGLLFIESNNDKHKKNVIEFMTSKGFVRNNELTGAQDTAWYNPKYCEKFFCGST